MMERPLFFSVFRKLILDTVMENCGVCFINWKVSGSRMFSYLVFEVDQLDDIGVGALMNEEVPKF